MTGKNKINIALIGCVWSTETAYDALLRIKNPNINLKLLITKKNSKFNSDFVNLTKKSNKDNIPIFYKEEIKSSKEELRILKKFHINLVFVIGWSYLIKEPTLSEFKGRIIGFHPSNLPKNRGRHPIVWSLALGLSETASTFFLINKNIDEGDLIEQKKIKINKNDNAKSLYKKILSVMPLQIQRIANNFFNEEIETFSNENVNSNSWRKREKLDERIDWRMSSENIYNLIRALSKPYPGAFFEFKGKEIKVWKSKIILNKEKNLEPGKILKNNKKSMIIKTGDNALLIQKSEMLKDIEGDYCL